LELVPSKGSAGGILFGIDGDLFDVEGWVIRVFFISCDVVSKKEGCRSRITTVYGATNEDRKYFFVDELHGMLLNRTESTIIGGDFNLVRYQKDKSNGLVDFKWCDKFNEWIDKHCLMEINLVGMCYTWSNNQENQILSHIDRIFCSTEFDAMFPLATTRALSRNSSYHVPILWESGTGQPRSKPKFKFEKWWLQHSQFRGLVSRIWKSKVVGGSAIERWQNKIRLFHRKAKGWSANVEAENSRVKESLK
jgi:hypothetical protein